MCTLSHSIGRSGTAPRLRLLVGTLLMASIAACGGAATTAPGARERQAPSTQRASVVSAPDLKPGQAVPRPEGKVVLSVTGKISTTNGAGSLRLDAGTLDQLGVLKVRLFDPWEKKNLDFQGVWLADVLKLAQVDGKARGLHLTALDDYTVDLTLDEIAAGGIFLATKTGQGSPIPLDDGGPIRIVFVGGVASGQNADQWIWSLKDLSVR